MKGDILRNLYQGKLNPFEHAVSKEDEYRMLDREIAEKRKNLMECLSEEGREQFEAWDQDVMKAGTMGEYANFAYGFRLGVLLMCEIMFAEEKEP